MEEKKLLKDAASLDTIPWGRPPSQPNRAGSGAAHLTAGAVSSRPMGAGTPNGPIDSEESPRLFQYPPGINFTTVPRAGYRLVPFHILRNFSDDCYQVKLNIELIKREIRALEWEIVNARNNDKNDYSDDTEEVTEFFNSPDGVQEFDSWVGSLLDDVLAIDALTLWPEMDGAGRLVALEQIDGSTIRPLLDDRGRIAKPPYPGLMQMLYGQPRSWFTTDRLLYRPFNTGPRTPYGSSPIENIILIVNLALRRDTYHLSYFTEGNIPEALIGAPGTWTHQQIETFQNYWDTLIAGNNSRMRRMFLWPSGGSGQNLPVYEFKKDDVNNTAADEWLMRVACWAFGNSPAEFGIIPGSGLGGSGFASGMENIQYRSIIGPISQWLARLFSRSIIGRLMGKPHLKFHWVGLDPQEDQLKQAQIDNLYIPLGVYGRAYVQDRLGIPQDQRPEAPEVSMTGALPGLPGFDTGQPFAGIGIAPGVQPAAIPAGYTLQRRAGSEGGPSDFFRRDRKSLE